MLADEPPTCLLTSQRAVFVAVKHVPWIGRDARMHVFDVRIRIQVCVSMYTGAKYVCVCTKT